MTFRNLLLALYLLVFLTEVTWASEAKPRIMVLTTGGTIAGQADVRSATGYNSAQLGAQQLLGSVPGVASLAQLSSEAVASIGSQNMTESVWFALARRINELLTRNEVDGIVITHGTDTMEETAFFLDLILPRGRPVVLVGAMRPSTALSADGPANIYNGIQVAASAAAHGRGVLIVLNGTIHGARDAQKMHSSALETFRSANAGPLGYVDASNVRFLSAATSTQRKPLRLVSSNPLPRVEIIYAHVQMDGAAIDAAIQRSARGIVVAGVGSGNVSDPAMAALERAVKAGLVVVRASRTGSGFVERNVEVDDDKLGFVTALDLTPQKARILAQLLIANGIADPTAIQREFVR